MEIDNSRHLCPLSTQKGIQTRIYSKTKFVVVKKTAVSHVQSKVLCKEVKDLLEKEAIEPVPLHQTPRCSFSTLFLVPRECGNLRPIINLIPLNQYLKKQHFKMDSLSKVLNLVKPNDWTI